MINVPIQVRDALREGLLKKEYNFTVYESDGTTTDFVLDNDDLVSESVKFDERMCSDTNLKFGLCEGTSLEFQYFGHGNITGRRIKAELKVQYNNSGSLSWYTIPMGYFTVDQCSRQASTGIIKVTAYNKLKSEYLDQKANALIQESFSHFETVKMMDIISLLLNAFKINQDETQIIPAYRYADIYLNTNSNYHYNVLYGMDTGIFGAGIFRQVSSSISTSSNIRFNIDMIVGIYHVSGDYPVQIRFTEDAEFLEGALYVAVKKQIKKAYFSVGENVVINDLLNITYSSWYEQDTLTGFFPHIEVIYKDGTQESYGQIVYDLVNGTGTFDDLNKITLTNVKKIYTIVPAGIRAQWYTGSGVTTSAGMDFVSETEVIYNYYPTQSDWTNNNPSRGLAYMPMLPDDSPYSNLYSHYVESREITNTTSADLVEVNISEMADVTLRDLQTAVFETKCQYGQIDRSSDLFKGIELNHNRLYPAESLYPANSLYPTSSSGDGQAERANKSMYSKLWADEGNIRSFRYLIITYKGTEDDGNGNLQEVEQVFQKTVDANGTDDYIMNGNWMFKNLVWDEEDIEDYADDMIAKMQGVTWFPFEMWCAGLPYVETGDEVEINLGQNAYKTYVLRRNIDGIQNLQDEMINGTLDIF